MSLYYDPATRQTATCNSDKADKDGNVWVEINGGMPQKKNWSKFIAEFKVILR